MNEPQPSRNDTHGAKPRVLFLVHRIPYPPDKGDKIRSFHELEALRQVADVSVACFVDDPVDQQHVPALRALCDDLVALPLDRRRGRLRSLVGLFGRAPLSLAFYRSAKMHDKVAALASGRPFDAVLVFSSTMAQYAVPFRDTRRVLDLCDLDSAKWAQYAEESSPPLSWIYRIEAKRLGAYECEAAREFDAAVLVSQAEGEELQTRSPEADVRVIPNGIDLAYFDPGQVDAAGDCKTLVFCGAMDYHSNIDAVTWFHDDILPRIRETHPDAAFRIVGSNPAPAVLRLARTPGVEVTGRVADVRPHLLSSAVSVAPLRLGRGVPNKILEALALTMPVVTTPNGAAGLPLAEFEGVDIAPDAGAFAEAVCRRLDAVRAGPDRYAQHRSRLAETHGWGRHMDNLTRLVLPAVD